MAVKKCILTTGCLSHVYDSGYGSVQAFGPVVQITNTPLRVPVYGTTT
jgi:hypothetical protein